MKRRIFSKKDGSTFKEDMHDIGEEIAAFLTALPAKIKAILPEAEDFVNAVQALSDAVKDGEPADIAIRKALEFIPGEQDTQIYLKAKHLLEQLVIRLQIVMDDMNDWDWSNAKKEAATELVISATNAEKRTASFAVEAAVYYSK